MSGPLPSPNLDFFRLQSPASTIAWDDIFPDSDFSSPPHAAASIPANWAGHVRRDGLELQGAAPAGPPWQSCRNPHGPCVGLAARTLKALHSNDSAQRCIFSSANANHHHHQPGASRGADAVLSANQAAVSASHSMLACRCYETAQLQLLVAVICAEAAAWYRELVNMYDAAAAADAADAGPEAIRQARAVSQRRPRPREPLLRRPLFVGSHRLDARLEAAVMSQILSAAVLELEDLVKAAARRSDECDRARSDAAATAASLNEMKAAAPDERFGMGAIHSRTGTFLHVQLDALRRDLAAFCSGTGFHA